MHEREKELMASYRSNAKQWEMCEIVVRQLVSSMLGDVFFENII